MLLLLLGRKPFVLADVEAALGVDEETIIFTATSLEEARPIIDEWRLDMVIMGAGLDLDLRLDLVRYVFENSESTTVHMKDRNSGREGMLPFVQALLRAADSV